MKEAAGEIKQRCPACGGELKLRLGALECIGCGYTPPEATSPGRERSAPAAFPSPSSARQAFFAPVRYVPPEAPSAGQLMYFEKRLCYRSFYFLQLLPAIAAIVVAGLITGWLAREDGSAAPSSSLLGVIWFCAALIVITYAGNAVIEMLVLRWVLFGDAQWNKWGCLFLLLLRVLFGAMACLVFGLTGQWQGEPAEPWPLPWRMLVLLPVLVLIFYYLWISYILLREISGKR